MMPAVVFGDAWLSKRWEFRSLGPVFGDLVWLGLDGGVYGIVPEVEEEGLLAIVVDEADGFVGEAIGEVFFVLAGLKAGDVGPGVLGVCIGVEKGSGLASVVASDVDLEAVGLGEVLLVFLAVGLQVPLADVGGLIASIAEGFGDGDFVQWQAADGLWSDELVSWATWPGDAAVVGEFDPAWVFAGHDAGAGWRADGIGRIGIGEAHALAGEPIDVRRLVEGGAVTAKVGPAEVVDENEDDVGPFGGCGDEGEQQEREEEDFHRGALSVCRSGMTHRFGTFSGVSLTIN